MKRAKTLYENGQEIIRILRKVSRQLDALDKKHALAVKQAKRKVTCDVCKGLGYTKLNETMDAKCLACNGKGKFG